MTEGDSLVSLQYYQWEKRVGQPLELQSPIQSKPVQTRSNRPSLSHPTTFVCIWKAHNLQRPEQKGMCAAANNIQMIQVGDKQEKKQWPPPTRPQVSRSLDCLFAVPICVLCTCHHQPPRPVAPVVQGPQKKELTLVANFKLVNVSLR